MYTNSSIHLPSNIDPNSLLQRCVQGWLHRYITCAVIHSPMLKKDLNLVYYSICCFKIHHNFLTKDLVLSFWARSRKLYSQSWGWARFSDLLSSEQSTARVTATVLQKSQKPPPCSFSLTLQSKWSQLSFPRDNHSYREIQ